MSDISGILAGMRAAPGLDPSLIYGISQSGADTNSIPDLAGGTQAYGQGVQNAAFLSAQTPTIQSALWQGASDDQKKQLTAAGYKAPAAPGQHFHGWWDRVKSDALQGVNKAFTAVNAAPVVGTALHYAAAPLRQVQRGYRILEYDRQSVEQQHADQGDKGFNALGYRDLMGFSGVLSAFGDDKPKKTDLGDLFGDAFTSLKDEFTPSNLHKAYRATDHGEHTFSPIQEREIVNKYGADTSALAKRLAGGDTFASILLAAPEDQRGALAEQLNNDPNLQKAVGEYQFAKLSPGRQMVGRSLFLKHPEVANKLAGSYDALVDLVTDPVVIGGVVMKSAEAGKYLVQSSEDVNRLYDTSQGYRNAINDMTTTLNKDGAAGLLRRRPSLTAPLIDGMVKDGVDSPEKMNAYFAGLADARNLADGKVNGVTSLIGKQAPHNFQVGTEAFNVKPGIIALDLKEAGKKLIDWSADIKPTVMDAGGTPTKLQSAMSAPGQFMRKMTTLTTSAKTIDPNAPQSITQVQRLADAFLPKSATDDIVNTWANAATVGAKKDIYTGLVGRVLKTAGWDDEQVAKFTGALKDNLGNARKYGVNDAVTTDGGQTPMGFLSQHFTESWSMPSYREIYANAQRSKALGLATSDAADFLMERLWKPSQLMRLGFPIRAGGEELVGQIMREGLGDTVKAKLGSSAVKGQIRNQAYNDVRDAADSLQSRAEQAAKDFASKNYDSIVGEHNMGDVELRKAAERQVNLLKVQADRAASELTSYRGDRLLPIHPFASLRETLLQRFPESDRTQVLLDTLHKPSELYSRYFGDATTRAFRNVEERLAGQKYVDAARVAWDHGGGEDAFSDMISAVHNHTSSYLDAPEGMWTKVKSGNKVVRSVLEPTGGYKNYEPGSELFDATWQHQLNMFRNDELGRVALKNIEMPHEDLVNLIAEKIKSPEFAQIREKAYRNFRTRDGQLLGEGATAEQTARDWASVVADNAKNLVQSPEGLPIGNLAKDLVRGAKVDYDYLSQIPKELRPAMVTGAEVGTVAINPIQEIVNKGFTNIVGKPMNAIARDPMYVHAIARARDELAPALEHFKALGMDDASAEQLLNQNAVQRAIHEITPFIHDPSQRSQFAVVTRNLIPFWFAQEQFYKRWARTFVHSPASFRVAQLAMGGFRHSGFIHTDDQGNDYFMYPAAGMVQNILTRGLGMIGVDATLPVKVGFSGQVRFATPGLERLGAPSFGPLVSIPVHALATKFPELKETEQAVLGDRGAGRAYWEQILPTTLTRSIHILQDSPDNSPQMASAMTQALQQMAANDQIPPEDASPLELERFNARVRDWARVLMVNRLIYGYSVPAAPEAQIDPDHLAQEYKSLLGSGIGVEEASRIFLKEHPDASAYTVFQSKSKSGGYLPAADSSLQFMQDHEEFLRKYPFAASWFMPQVPKDTEKFSIAAYREQLALGLRERKSFDEIENDIYYADAADVYFQSRDRKDASLAQYKGTSKAGDVRNAWAQWKDTFLKQHPIFAADLADPKAQLRRQESLRELGVALKDGSVPGGPQTAHVKEMVASYDRFNNAMLQLSGYNTSAVRNQRAGLKTAFITWAKQYTAENPDTEAMYNKLIRPDVDPQDNTTTAVGG